MIDHYRCCHCGYEYRHNAHGLQRMQPNCRKCDSEYIKWLNWPEVRRAIENKWRERTDDTRLA